MGNKTRIAAAAVSAVMALSVVPQAAFATNNDSEYADAYTKIASRLGGLDRAQTAAKIADAYNQDVDTVIITVGRNFPDALASTPLADQLDAPVLLNDGARLNDPTSKWLFDNTPANIVIVGGAGIIPQTVLNDITEVYKQKRAGFEPNFTRYSGVDRNETAYQVSARTVAGYYEAGVCRTSGVSVSYTAKQQATADVLAEADANLENVQGMIDAYNAAKAEYERTKAAFDAADLKVQQAEARVIELREALEALTSQLQVTGDIAALQAEVARQGQIIAADAEVLAGTQALYDELLAIMDAAIQAGVEGTEENVWENLYITDWDHMREQLPTMVDSINRVVDAFGGATVGDTRDAANAQIEAAQDALTEKQSAYAEAVAALAEALEADAANKAIAAQITEASKQLVAAEQALSDARAERAAAWEAYQTAADAYAALVDDPATTPGALANAQAAVAKALDGVVAAADNVPVFLGTGRVFADSLTAGPAAADQCGVILLTENDKMSDPTIKWLQAANPQVVAAVGGPARTAAASSATVSFVGKDRFETAKLVNLRYLSDRNVLGIATGYDYPDALTGAALVANADGGMLLVNVTNVPYQTSLGIQGGDWTQPVIFGGTGAVSAEVSAEINGILN